MLEQLLRLWKTQQEYGYWETRLREGLYFEPTRHAAKREKAQPTRLSLVRRGRDLAA